MIFYYENSLKNGKEVILPIRIYGSRDSLSGHFLRYEIFYHPTQNFCRFGPYAKEAENAYLCLQKKSDDEFVAEKIVVDLEQTKNCYVALRGRCKSGYQFVADIERFFIPQKHALILEKFIREKKAEIVLVVGKNGSPVIRDMRFDKKSWRDFLPH